MQQIALLTKHDKVSAVAGPLEKAGFEVLASAGFDTDQLGTFTREVARQGSQLDAAFAKAKRATDLEGCRYGLGSEGSFGADPYLGVAPWGIEVLAWWDAELGYGVHAVAQGPNTNYAQATISTSAAAMEFATKIGFPEHGLILGKSSDIFFSKNIATKRDMAAAVEQALKSGPLWLETDMRAHRNPTRMAMIRRCAELLAQRLMAHCPACRNPGFGTTGLVPGATCDLCGGKTRVAQARQLRCNCCGHMSEELLRKTTDPMHCDYCNP